MIKIMDLRDQKVVDGKLHFTLYNESAHIANRLRRITLEEVPTLAIDIINITENTSAIMDEILAHRCGLIPIISTAVSDFVFPDNCTCEANLCSNCAVIFDLNVRADKDFVWVTEKDFRTSNTKVYPVVYPEKYALKITQLKKGQHIALRAVVRKGTGSQHAKWIPVVVPTMNYEDDDVNEDGVFKKIEMSFESVGQLPLEDILIDALVILRKQLIRLAYQLNLTK
jgi:DNA-directed RNA polymerase II subunit RPB3